MIDLSQITNPNIEVSGMPSSNPTTAASRSTNSPAKKKTPPARAQNNRSPLNVGKLDRDLSLIAGTVLSAYGASRLFSFRGLAITALGAGLLSRGATGHCGLYDHLGVSTADGE